jgi:hypothetical protein
MKLILMMVMLTASLISYAEMEIVAYKTYEDYLAKKGDKMDSYFGRGNTKRGMEIYFKQDGKEITVSAKNYWGFKAEDCLFRFDSDNQLIKLANNGKIVYWENGMANLQTCLDLTTSSQFIYGHPSYFSVSLNGEVTPLSIKTLKKFKEEHPEHAELCDCIGEDFDDSHVRFCIAKYEGLALKEIVLYKTYEDYVSENGEKMDFYAGWDYMGTRTSIDFKKGNELISVNASKYWGFKIDDCFFRFDEYGTLIKLVSNGKIVYWENGLANLEMCENGTTSAEVNIGYFCYLSTTLDGKVTPLPRDKMDTANKPWKKFKEEHPEHAKLFECIGNSLDYDLVRGCVARYEN